MLKKLFNSIVFVVTALSFFTMTPAIAIAQNISPCSTNIGESNSKQGDDPKYKYQWHLTGERSFSFFSVTSGLVRGGQHINVQPVWDKGIYGEGIVVGVVDSDACEGHLDLRENFKKGSSRDYVTGRYSHGTTSRYSHGTGVAGIIAASANNKEGGRGVAPKAKVFSLNAINEYDPATSQEMYNALTMNHKETAVYNNSWGGDPFEEVDGQIFEAIKKGIEFGFNGKGSVYVFSAGNSHCLRDSKNTIQECGYDNSNYDMYMNSYAVIPVCAVNVAGVRTPYSEMGANLWVCAPSKGWRWRRGQGIYTTDSDGTKIDDYEPDFRGTSAAAPQVSGVVALMRQANRELTWRDVKLILAATAKKVDVSNEGCNPSSAYPCGGNGNWLSGGIKYGSEDERYYFNHQYGFGLVDAAAAVELAERWTTSVPKLTTMTTVSHGNTNFSGCGELDICINSSVTINTNNIDFIEFIEVTLKMWHPSFSDVAVNLISTSGSVSELAVPVNDNISEKDLGSINNYWKKRKGSSTTPSSWRFGSARHLGEDPNGTWRLEITDRKTDKNGNSRLGDIGSWEIKIYGRKRSNADNSDLSSLELLSPTGSINLNEVFSANRVRYTASVSSNINSISVIPTPSDSKASVTVNNKHVPKGGTHFIPLNRGPTSTIEIVVTAQNASTKKYTVMVTRAASTQQGNDNNLSGLSLSNGVSLNFSPSRTSYTVRVANSISSIRVTPTASDSAATIRVGSRVVASGNASNSISLSEGVNTIGVSVISGNGDVNTYTITLIRAAAAGSNLSDDATLSNLRLSSINFNESFSSGRSSYTADIGSNIANVTITSNAHHRGATITVDGSSVASGSSRNIPITSNQQTIRVVVTSEDGGTVRTYTIALTRAQGGNADLTNLSIEGHVLGDFSNPTIFSSDDIDYKINVYETKTTIKMIFTARDPGATIMVNEELAESGALHEVDISNTNVITASVTSGDGRVTKTYYFRLIRINYVRISSLTSTPYLDDLRVVQPSGRSVRLERLGSVYSGFKSTSRDYSADVATDVGSVTITPTTKFSDATITINGTLVNNGSSKVISLNKGRNTITIVLTRTQGNISAIYTLEIERAESDDATLQSLQFVHIIDRETSKEVSLTPPFSSRERRYEIRVGSSIEYIDVFPVANGDGAEIRINNRRLRDDSDDVRLDKGESEIEVEVTSESRDRTRAYIVDVWRGSEDDATLHDLKLLGEVDRFRFRSDDTSYRVNVGSVVESLTVVPIANDLEASITVNGTSVNSGASQTINLNDGRTTIVVAVTSADEDHTESYTIEINRASRADVSLRGTPSLSARIDLVRGLANETIFTGEASHDIDRTTVEINTNDLSAQITVNNESVVSGGESSNISLDVGVNIITVNVVSSDRQAGQIYTIIVTRKEAPVDHDSDDDNLIEIRNLEQLDAMRYGLDDSNIHPLVFPGYDRDNSCHSRCIGYELMADLDFEDDASYRDLDNKQYWTGGAGWQPIGITNRDCDGSSQCFTATFDGNGHSIGNLFINRRDERYVGLFSGISGEAHIRNIGIVDVQIVGGSNVGTLVGINDGGRVSDSYATGNITGNDDIGGLVGHNFNGGTVTGSYAVVNILGDGIIGGLVGQNSASYREDSGGIISDSYASGKVSGHYSVGGLVGRDSIWRDQAGIGSISNSYAIGIVSGLRVGGFRGLEPNGYHSGSVSNSYWNTETTGQTQSNGGVSLTTQQMLSPTAPNERSHPARYTNWEAEKWHFGNNQQYPAVLYSVDCETISSNNPNQNEGNLHRPDCGDLLSGQRTYLAALSLSSGVTWQHPFNRLSTHYVATVDSSVSSIGIMPTSADSMDAITINTETIASSNTHTIFLQPGKNVVSIVVTGLDGSIGNYTVEIWQTIASDYDIDDDNLIEISNLEQLNAIRYDLDGDGISDDSRNYELYQRAYPGFSGCMSLCIGYELETNLDFQDIASYQDINNQPAWIGSEGWQPIGVGYGKFFKAIFEGNDRMISNLFIDRESSTYVGLFGFITGSARVKNIAVINVQVKGHYQVGGLIGSNYGTVSDSYVTGNISGYYLVGGLVGYGRTNSVISNSYAHGSVSGDNGVGGLVGSYGGTVSDSYAHGSVSGDNGVGGLVGHGWANSEISNSYAHGSVSGDGSVGGLVGSSGGTVSDSYVTGNISGNNQVGGLVGYGGTNSAISNSYVHGDVSGDDDAGGLVGRNYGTVSDSYVTGNISGNDEVGGLIGSNNGTVSGSYSIGDVLGDEGVGGLIGSNENSGIVSNNYTSSSVSGNEEVGGLIGSNEGTVSDSYAASSVSGNGEVGGLVGDNYKGTVRNSYAIGIVTGGQYTGGLIGNNICIGDSSCATAMITAGTVSSGYWNIETTAQTESDGGIALTTEQMLSPEMPDATNPSRYSGWTAADWDFGNNQQYPAVRYAEHCENITDNDIYRNEGDVKQADCGDLLPGQRINLTNLVLSNNVILFPTFNRSYRYYTTSVNSNVSTLQITPTAETNNTIRINDIEVVNGNAHTISLQQGSNTITISVIGEDGSIKTYNIIVLRAASVNYDTDGDNLIEINSLEQLNAIRYDTNGDGISDRSSDFEDYLRVYPGLSGCSNICVGYELVDNLDFQDNASYQDIANQSRWISGEGWQPILSFNSTFEGNNHTISNLFIDRKDIINVGLFGITGDSAQIRNSRLIDIRLIGASYVGGLIGFSRGMISNSYATGNIKGYSDIGGLIGKNHGTVSGSYAEVKVEGTHRVGGLIGESIGVVSGSYARGSISGDSRIGGLIGENYGMIFDSYAAGDVSGDSRIGGLIGIGESHSLVSDSYAIGDVLGAQAVGGLIGFNNSTASKSYATGSVSGTEYVGGLIGYSNKAVLNSYASGHVLGVENIGGLIGENDDTVSNSYAFGNVSGDEFVGGLIGNNDNTVSNSYASGSVSGDSHVGGLIGDNRSGEISNSYAMGNVSGNSYVGGLVGDNAGSRSSNDPLGKISNSYAIGYVKGIEYIGGLVGSNICINLDNPSRCSRYPIAEGTITASYWDSDTTKQTRNNGGTPLTMLEMVTPVAPNAVRPNRYRDWDLDNWHFGNNEQYPAVRYIENCETITRNNPNLNENDLKQPDCSDLLPGQRHAHLLSLSLSDNAVLVPLFNKTILNYTVRVVPYLPSIGIAVTAESGVRTITVNGTTVASGDAHTVLLSSPKNIINISVTALDHDIKTYSITVWKVSQTNYDTNGNNLIEIRTLEQLDAMRYDLNGDGISDSINNRDIYLEAFLGFTGCSSTCTGFELTNRLDFQDDRNYKNISNKSDWTSGKGWLPISKFNAVFEGNGHQISNLFIDRENSIGLFGSIGEDAYIRNLGLIDIQVRGRYDIGGLIGENAGGIVSNSYAEGDIEGAENRIGGLIGSNRRGSTVFNNYAKVSVSGNDSVGGLVGYNYFNGTISNSYAESKVSGDGAIGGLVGDNRGTIINSYATGNVTGNSRIGGLVGGNINIGTSYPRYRGGIGNSYAIGRVSGEEYAGGLVGHNLSNEGVNNSHWNTESSRQLISDGGTGLTKLLMTIPTMLNEDRPNYYIGWDIAHWNFGNTRQYPALRYSRDCEHVGSNFNLNEGTAIPDCDDLLPGQRDVSLESLRLSNNVELTPAFDKEIADYNAQVLMGLRHLAVRATVSDDVESVSVNGNPVARESLTTVSLGTSETIVTIVVVGGNGTIAKSYVLTITQRGNNVPQINQRLTDQIAEVGMPFSYSIPQNAFVDTDGDNLIYYTIGLPQRIDWFSDDGITFDPSDNTFAGIPGYRDASPNPNQHIVTVGVNDGYGGTTETSFMLLVNSEPTGTLRIDADIENERLIGLSTLDDANNIVDMDYQWQKIVTRGGELSYVDLEGAESLSYPLPNTNAARSPGVSYRLNSVMLDGIGEISGYSADYTLPNWPPHVVIRSSTNTVVEGGMVTLEAIGNDINLDEIIYGWQQIGGFNVLRNISREEQTLQFTVPADGLGRGQDSAMLAFEVKAKDKFGSSSTQVIIQAVKADNGQITTLGQPAQNGNRLTAPSIDLASDIDGIGRVTSYQWQISTNNSVSWTNINEAGTNAEYVVPTATTDGTQFRVVVNYEDGQGYSALVFSKAATYAASNSQPRIDFPIDNTRLSIIDKVSTNVVVVVSDANTSDTLTVTLNVVAGDDSIESTPTRITIVPSSELSRPAQTFFITIRKSGNAVIRIDAMDDSGVAVNQNAVPVTLQVETRETAIKLRVKVFLEGNFR